MTPTSDERREVAERLRVYSHDFDFGDSNPFWYVAKAAFGDVDVRTYYSVFARLADIIDPTCHDFGGEEGTNGEGYDFACSACGYVCDLAEPRFCPYCGARVVEGGDA